MCHCIMTSLIYPCNQITPVQQSHTSMICLGGLEESITDEVIQSSRSSSASETETNHTKQHVYVGKAPRKTTVREMFALLYNIGVKDIFTIRGRSKYNHQYMSFCVTLQDLHDMDIVLSTHGVVA